MIRVFPRRTKWTPTDPLAFIGDPPLFRPVDQRVKISVVFTKDINEGERLYRSWGRFYDDVELGGPAFDDSGEEFVPGMFLSSGRVITSRGCSKECPWCFVPKREGIIRELPINDGYDVVDNNLLACSDKHVIQVFDMLRRQKESARFSGGLDAELFHAGHAELLRSIRLKFAWFAADCPGAIGNLEKVRGLLHGMSREKLRCYVLIGFSGESLGMAEKRLRQVYDLGFLPQAMLYRPEVEKRYDPEWNKLYRIWSRPAIYRSLMGDTGCDGRRSSLTSTR